MINETQLVYNEIIVDIEDAIAYITIHRPEVMNALSRNTKKELLHFFQFANDSENFKAIIITGEGNRAFCAGTDLKDMANFNSIDAEQMLWLEHRLNNSIRHCNKPIIAAVNGNALGGGCLIPLMCDYTIVADSAKLGFPEINAGLPASIEIAIVHSFIGLARAKELIYFGEFFTPQEALAMGLINRVVPQQQVLVTAKEIALKFIDKSPTALRLQKELVNKWIETDFVSAVETSIYAAGLAFTTGEPQAAINKFLTRPKKSAH